MYDLKDYINDLREIAASAGDEDELFTRLSPLAARLANNRDWIRPEYYAITHEDGSGSVMLHEEPDHSLAVFVGAWDAGGSVVPHNHHTWAIVAGVEGEERNLRYRRLDDRSDPQHARLEVRSSDLITPGEVICMKTEAIHSVHNDSGKVTLTLHTYGMHPGYLAREQFDIETGKVESFEIDLEG